MIFRKIYWTIKNFIDQIFVVIDYLPTLYKDRDWDSHFFYLIIRKKLQRMEKRLYRGWFIGWERQVARIHLCILLIDRLTDEHGKHTKILWDNFYKKYGESKMEFGPVDEKTGCGEVKFSYSNNNEEEYKKELFRVMDHEDYLKDQDRKMLFAILEKWLPYWWD